MRILLGLLITCFCLSAGAEAPLCEEMFLLSTPQVGPGKWSEPQLVAIIQALAAQGIPINAKAVERDQDGRIIAYLKSLGLDATVSQFYKAIQRRFGPWDNILRAAGFEPENIRGARWSVENVIAALEGMSAAGIPLNSRYVIDDPDGRVAAYLKENKLPGNSPSSFFTTAQRLFDNWDNALRSAGLDPARIRLSTPFWTEPRMIGAISDLNKAGIPLNVVSILRDHAADVRSYLVSKKWPVTSPGALIHAADRLFGGWSEALLAAELDPNQIRIQAPQWKAPQITKMIQDLKTRGLPLNFKSLSEDTDGKIAAAFLELGTSASPAAFAMAAVAKFGSWDEALRQAGLDPIEVRKYAPPWTAEAVMATLAGLRDREIPLNATSVRYDVNGDIANYLIRVKKTGGTSGALLQAAARLYGSWDRALIATNINPDEVRLTGTTPFHLLKDWMKREREGGNGWFPTLQGQSDDGVVHDEWVDAIDLEKDLMDRQKQETVNDAIENLSSHSRELFARLVQLIEEREENDDANDSVESLLNEIASSKGSTFSAADSAALRTLLDELTQNSALRDSLSGDDD